MAFKYFAFGVLALAFGEERSGGEHLSIFALSLARSLELSKPMNKPCLPRPSAVALFFKQLAFSLLEAAFHDILLRFIARISAQSACEVPQARYIFFFSNCWLTLFSTPLLHPPLKISLLFQPAPPPSPSPWAARRSPRESSPRRTTSPRLRSSPPPRR